MMIALRVGAALAAAVAGLGACGSRVAAPPPQVAAPVETVSPARSARRCAASPPLAPIAFAEVARKERDGAEIVAPRIATDDAELAASAHAIQRSVDEAAAFCPSGCAREVDCTFVRNDARFASIDCQTAYANGAKALSYDRGLSFQRSASGVRPIALGDLAGDGKPETLARQGSWRADYFLLGDDALVLGTNIELGSLRTVLPGSALRDALACDDALEPRAGAANAPLAHAMVFDTSPGSARRAPRFFGAGAAREKAAAALNADIEAWLAHAGQDGSVASCRVTLSTSSLVSVLCTAFAEGAGFTYRLADESRVTASDLLGRLPGAGAVIAKTCFADDVRSGAAARLPVLAPSDLDAFALEASEAVLALRYASAIGGHEAMVRTKLCRVPYRALRIQLEELSAAPQPSGR